MHTQLNLSQCLLNHNLADEYILTNIPRNLVDDTAKLLKYNNIRVKQYFNRSYLYLYLEDETQINFVKELIGETPNKQFGYPTTGCTIVRVSQSAYIVTIPKSYIRFNLIKRDLVALGVTNPSTVNLLSFVINPTQKQLDVLRKHFEVEE